MSSLGTKRGILEIFKFGVYLSVPIFLMYGVANNPNTMHWIVQNRSYVVDQDEGLRPPPPEEILEIARKLREERKHH